MDLLSHYRAQIEAVVAATTIYAPTRYAWFGVGSPPLPRHIRRAMTPATARSYLLYQLQAQLYRDFYCTGGATRPPALAPPARLAGLTPFVARLQAANAGTGYWDPGWQILAALEPGLVAGQGALALWVSDQEAAWTESPAPGAGIRLRFPKDLLGNSPGFYMAVSDTPLPPAPDLVRCYWHVTAEGAVSLLALATRQLNEAGIPFKLKVVNDPRHFTRCDAAVLYIRQADYAGIAPILERIYPALAPHLRASVPALTKPLAPGLGLAEDPGGGESFGLQRCLLLADGLLRAFESGARALPARLEIVLDRLTEARVGLGAPFLRPGAQDTYSFRLPPIGAAPQPHAQSHPALPVPDPPAAYRTVAEQIGRRIVREAIWYADQCNWVGAALPDIVGVGQGSLVYRALGPDLYAGTSGVALFLAELSAVTGDPVVRRTAIGALRQALAQAERLPPASRLAFYTGWVGLAYAAVRLGRLLDQEEFSAAGLRLLQSLQDTSVTAGAAYDWLSGRAGAIAGLLVLGTAPGERPLHEFAAQLGQDLITAADKTARGYSWATPGGKNHRHLTGLSHGAAGIGAALLELYAETDDAAYREAGERAYAYEQSWFDPVAANWPDFRPAWGGRGSRHVSAFATYWCHGAPGIALTRLRAFELLGTAHYASEAALALQTTQAATQRMLVSGQHDFSLCHGLAGNADVLLHAASLGQQSAPLDADIIKEIAHFGIVHYSGDNQPWPCGVNGGETPGLMLGWAGIGLFYLRLFHSEIPSILLLTGLAR